MIHRVTLLSLGFAFSLGSTFTSTCLAARFLTHTPQAANAAPVRLPQSTTDPLVWISPGAGSTDTAWHDYISTWRQHGDNPADAAVRQRLGLPLDRPLETSPIDSRTVPRLLPKGLRVDWGSPQALETEHFYLIADLPQDTALDVAFELETFHAVWTQMFFPLWKNRQRWDATDPQGPARMVPAHSVPGREPVANKMRVVVFRNLAQYQSALRSEGPQISKSNGYYSASLRTTFLLYAADQDRGDPATGEAQATLYHELTHQLFAEATDSKLRTLPGERTGFWLAEGIACYMESTILRQGYATVGGWEASRLQFARHRLLNLDESASTSRLRSLGRIPFQRHPDIANLYCFAAAETHRIIDHQQGDGLIDLLVPLAQLYQIRVPASSAGAKRGATVDQGDLAAYLKLNDQTLSPTPHDDLLNLCLARCELSVEAIERIVPQRRLAWLDLTGLGVKTRDVVRLCPESATIKQLSLEATAIDDTIATWISGASRIEELDLSWTDIGDQTVSEIAAAAPLQTLWLTGSNVSDSSIDRIAAWRSLRRVDLQKTRVTPSGRARLASLRPDLKIDPLQWANGP